MSAPNLYSGNPVAAFSHAVHAPPAHRLAIPPQVVQPPPKVPSEALEEEDEGDEGGATNVFAAYSCKSLSFGCPHPADVSESAGLDLVPLPKATYPLQDSIPKSLIETGKLSSLQLEGVSYACQRHCTMLPDGTRAGFFLGDGAGIGKGRQISGILLDNWARGRRQHVWISTSADLKLDAERDLRDLGVHVKVIDGPAELDAETKALGLSQDFKEGVLFVTYSTLIGAARGGKVSRLDQIVNWCKSDSFEGVIVLDECHKAKNFQVGENSDSSTKTSKCVIELQRRLPKARVVYSSATGVTELNNLAYCERLGLWGKGSPFSCFEDFLNVVSKRGVFFLEMLAMELKRSGAYVSRGLSFGAAEFETVLAKLTPAQQQMYDGAAAFWYQARVKLQRAVEKTNAARTMQLYWSAHQRFFRQLIVAFKVDAVCDDAEQCLEEGHAVVIGLQQTGEAVMTRRLNASKGVAAGWLSSSRETILSFLEQHFPVEVREVSATAQGAEEEVEVVEVGGGGEAWRSSSASQAQGGLSQGEAAGHRAAGAVDEECAAMREELLASARSLQLPFSALDMFIERLGGPKCVAEMTGRTGRLVRGRDGGVVYELRGKGDSDLERVNVAECKKFMDGEKFVAIISDAASTGISLHARRGGGNERRRVHFTVELPWSADKAVQQLGRSHRSDQSSAPIYRLVVTDLGGERRFASAVAKRLQSLGALTKGDRRAAAGQDLQEFNLDTVYGKHSLRKVLDAIELGAGLAAGANATELLAEAEVESVEQFNSLMSTSLDFIGITQANRKETEAGGVRRFLGRLLGLPVQQQQALYQYFFSVLKHAIATAQKEGRYSDTITDLFGGEGAVVERAGEAEAMFTDPFTGSTCAVHRLRVDRGMSWEQALARLEGFGREGGNGFYESRREVPGRQRKGWLLATRKSADSFVVARPNTGLSRQEMDASELEDKYALRPDERAAAAWARIFAESVTYARGARVVEVALVCGSLVQLWNVLQDIVHAHALRAEKEAKGSVMTVRDAGMKVVRVKVGAEHLVGLRLPPQVVADVRSKLKEYQLLLSGRAVKVAPPPMTPQGLMALQQMPGTRFPVRMYAADKLVDGYLTMINGSIMVTFTTPDGVSASFPLPRGHGGYSLAPNAVLVTLPAAKTTDDQGKAPEVGNIEPVTEVDPASLKRAMSKPPTLLKFFSKASEAPSLSADRIPRHSSIASTGPEAVVNVDRVEAGSSSVGEKRKHPDALKRGVVKDADARGRKATPPTEKKPRTVLSFFQPKGSSQPGSSATKQADTGSSQGSLKAPDTIDLTLD